MKSPYNALGFVLARHIRTFNFLCLFEFIFGQKSMANDKD